MGKTSDPTQCNTNEEQKTRKTEPNGEQAVEPANSEFTESGDATGIVDGEEELNEVKGASGDDSAKPDKPDTETNTVTDTEADQVSKMQETLTAERDKYLRLAAEYDNFRKRSAKERENTYCDARVDVILRLLPVYDNLERALKMECADEAFYKGIDMTMTQLMEIFKGMDVRHIPAVGDPFDPNLHNAVMTIVDPELGEKVVAQEFQKGFMLGQRVIRHSTVVVAN